VHDAVEIVEIVANRLVSPHFCIFILRAMARSDRAAYSVAERILQARVDDSPRHKGQGCQLLLLVAQKKDLAVPGCQGATLQQRSSSSTCTDVMPGQA